MNQEIFISSFIRSIENDILYSINTGVMSKDIVEMLLESLSDQVKLL